MFVFIEHVSKSGSTRITHTVYGNTPYGDYLLLKEQYRAQDENYEYDKCWRKRVEFSSRFLRKMKSLAKNHNLCCAYCGKPDLKVFKPHDKKDKSKMATTDHFYPKSKGGKPFDEANLIVACLKCNGKKKDSLYDLDSLKHLSRYKNHEEIINNLK